MKYLFTALSLLLTGSLYAQIPEMAEIEQEINVAEMFK